MTEDEFRGRLAFLGDYLNTGYRSANGMYTHLSTQKEEKYHYSMLVEAVNQINTQMAYITREHKARVAAWDKKEKENQTEGETK